MQKDNNDTKHPETRKQQRDVKLTTNMMSKPAKTQGPQTMQPRGLQCLFLGIWSYE